MSWIYITCIGKTLEAVYSPLWALIEEGLKPSRIHLLYTKETRKSLEEIKKILEAIAEVNGSAITADEIDEVDIEGISEKIRDLTLSFRDQGFSVVVDVTPGRKPMSIALFQGAINAQANLVTYLHLMDGSFEKWPYPLIPRSIVRLVELYGSKPKIAKPKPQLALHDELIEIEGYQIYPFINCMCEYANRHAITIKLPYLNIKLLTIRLEKQPIVDHVADQIYFTEMLKKRGIKIDEATLPFGKEEKSIYTLFRDALIASGALTLDIEPIINEVKENMERLGVAYIALDTNTLNMRFTTSYILPSLSREQAEKLKVLVASAVLNEALKPHLIDKQFKEVDWRKEREKIISLAQKANGYVSQLDDYAEPLKSRLSRLASIELKELKGRIQRIDSSSEKGDMAIIESYEKSREKPILITGDKALFNVASIRGLTTHLIDMNAKPTKQDVNITYTNLPKLVFTLATLLTTITIEIPDTQITTTIIGAWRDMAWSKPTIKASAPNPIHQKAKQQIEKTAQITLKA